jgi:hypothetical protein
VFGTDTEGISLNIFHADGSVDKALRVFSQQWAVTRNNVSQSGAICHDLSFSMTCIVKEKCPVFFSTILVCKFVEYLSQLLICGIGYQFNFETKKLYSLEYFLSIFDCIWQLGPMVIVTNSNNYSVVILVEIKGLALLGNNLNASGGSEKA